ncbi:predicted protein [Postia placenta Mad-698-R]|nr:predicted protein [Postia placenta Mad-698-R]
MVTLHLTQHRVATASTLPLIAPREALARLDGDQSQTTGGYPAADSHADTNTGIGAEDLYSNLSSYTFGSARPSRTEFLEMISPFSAPGPSSSDPTPRPSVSGPSSDGSAPPTRHTNRSRTPRTRPRDIEDDGSTADREDDGDEEGHMRTKMRAMNDGTRRPSLPMISYPSERSQSPPISPTTSRSRPHPQRKSDSPEAESESGTSYVDGDEGDADIGDFDTDIELDFHHNSVAPATHDVDMSDAVLQHTFRGGYGQYVYKSGSHSNDGGQGDDHGDDGHDGRKVASRILVTDADLAAHAIESSQVRRGSLPWNITEDPAAGSSGIGRGREDSLATSQSAGLADMSNVPAINPSENGTGGTSVQPPPRDLFSTAAVDLGAGVPAQSDSNALADFDLGYILGGTAERDRRKSWQSTAPSWMQVPPHTSSDPQAAGFENFEFPGWGAPVTGPGGRRPSTITVGSFEDAFTRHVQRFDPVSNERAVEWSFKRETVDGLGPDIPINARWVLTASSRALAPGQQELWRHAHVGRFKIEKLLLRLDDPNKPPSQRINVRHIPDPYSRGNTLGGPVSVVHKHSRAIAFSLFRKHNLFNRSRSGATSMPTSGSILLATRRIQEQYTSTRSTNQLKSHGLLKDGKPRSRETSGQSTTLNGSGLSSRERSHSRDARDKQKAKGKGKEYTTGTSSQTASAGSVTSRTAGSEDESVVFARPHSTSTASGGRSVPVSPTVVESQFAYSTASASERALTLRSAGDGPSTSKYGSPPSTASSDRASARADSMIIDEDDEQVLPRTSHAEAFATLDQNSIEYLRGRSELIVPDHDGTHARSITERLRRRLLGQNPVKAISRPPAGPPVAALEGHYTPPWMTMAPRSRVEERDRVIQNLNESFKDVGLLPSFRTKGSGKPRRRNTDTVNIFSHVPDDSLYMLLPLWPGDTNAQSKNAVDDTNMYSVPLEERQYLLVYYVPLAERRDNKKDGNKKRSRSNSRAGSSVSTDKSKLIQLSSFSVCARLISYHDLLGTGVRLPLDGLSITGPMAEAMDTLPSAAVRESRLETPCAIIGICYGLEKGIEFLPDGLAKVGLAVVLPSENPVVSKSVEAEAEELNYEMTPIGRAAVEMAWLGCLAMTKFGPEPQLSK